MKDGFLDRHVPTIRALYKCAARRHAGRARRARCRAWTCSGTRPTAACSCGRACREGVNAVELLPQGGGARRGLRARRGLLRRTSADPRTLRLSFVTASAEQIDTGIAALAAADPRTAWREAERDAQDLGPHLVHQRAQGGAGRAGAGTAVRAHRRRRRVRHRADARLPGAQPERAGAAARRRRLRRCGNRTSSCATCARSIRPGSSTRRTLRARFDAERWMDWQQTTLNPAGRDAFVQLVRTPADKRDAGS